MVGPQPADSEFESPIRHHIQFFVLTSFQFLFWRQCRHNAPSSNWSRISAFHAGDTGSSPVGVISEVEYVVSRDEILEKDKVFRV